MSLTQGSCSATFRRSDEPVCHLMDSFFNYLGDRICLLAEQAGFQHYYANTCLTPGGYLNVGHSGFWAAIGVIIGVTLLFSRSSWRAKS